VSGRTEPPRPAGHCLSGWLLPLQPCSGACRASPSQTRQRRFVWVVSSNESDSTLALRVLGESDRTCWVKLTRV